MSEPSERPLSSDSAGIQPVDPDPPPNPDDPVEMQFEEKTFADAISAFLHRVPGSNTLRGGGQG